MGIMTFAIKNLETTKWQNKSRFIMDGEGGGLGSTFDQSHIGLETDNRMNEYICVLPQAKLLSREIWRALDHRANQKHIA
jgi:hypothetical protein